jgi:hypothetical protein
MQYCRAFVPGGTFFFTLLTAQRFWSLREARNLSAELGM